VEEWVQRAEVGEVSEGHCVGVEEWVQRAEVGKVSEEQRHGEDVGE